MATKKITKKANVNKVKDSMVDKLKSENEELKAELESHRTPTIEEIREANAERPEQKYEHIEEGFKRPSITDVKPAHTKSEYKNLIELYKKQNLAKYNLKKSELDAKLRAMK